MLHPTPIVQKTKPTIPPLSRNFEAGCPSSYELQLLRGLVRMDENFTLGYIRQ